METESGKKDKKKKKKQADQWASPQRSRGERPSYFCFFREGKEGQVIFG
jgi:hypothetical protein